MRCAAQWSRIEHKVLLLFGNPFYHKATPQASCWARSRLL